MRLVRMWGMLSWGEEELHLGTVELVFRGCQDMTRGTEKDSCLGTGLEGRDRLDHGSWACKAGDSCRGASRADHHLPSHLSPWWVPSLVGPSLSSRGE